MRNIQASGTLYGKSLTVRQVQKRTARRLYNEGQTIYLQSSNMRPFNAWQQLFKTNFTKNNYISFESLCNEYTWYNCDNERGKYISFYVAAKQ